MVLERDRPNSGSNNELNHIPPIKNHRENGVKFEGDAHANHLAKTLKRNYDVTVDWKG